MEGVEEIGKKAYQKQMWGAYEEAIGMYSNAISRFPNDSRLMNNRCMCYIELQDYRKALEEAENMILLFPNNKKAHYRKGEVLMHLKSYPLAISAFKTVLALDPNCEDAIRQLTEARIQILLKRVKHPRKQIERALRMKGNLEEAEVFLKSGEFDAMNEKLEKIIYYSDGESGDGPDYEDEYNILMDPTNPYGCLSLWVGNLTKATTEKSLTDLFSKYGKVKSFKFGNDGQFAFINFFDAAGPAKAMKFLQGAQVHGKSIVIKYPDSAFVGKKLVKSK